jgi:nucleotide-binding universal stress UspA family protein
MRILVPLDTSKLSQTALPHATELAEGLGADMLLVTIADPETRLALQELAAAEHEEPADILESNLRSMARSISGPEVTIDLLPGDDPASAIVDRAARGDVDMIVIATHGRTGLKRWRMGSVAERVVRGSTVPVLVVPAPWRKAEAQDGPAAR